MNLFPWPRKDFEMKGFPNNSCLSFLLLRYKWDDLLCSSPNKCFQIQKRNSTQTFVHTKFISPVWALFYFFLVIKLYTYQNNEVWEKKREYVQPDQEDILKGKLKFPLTRDWVCKWQVRRAIIERIAGNEKSIKITQYWPTTARSVLAWVHFGGTWNCCFAQTETFRLPQKYLCLRSALTWKSELW